jgi:hypothetical protein
MSGGKAVRRKQGKTPTQTAGRAEKKSVKADILFAQVL